MVFTPLPECEIGGYIRSGDASIYCTLLSREPTLIFLHGNSMNQTEFHHQNIHFSGKGFGTLHHNQRGEKPSTLFSSPEDYSLDTMVNDLSAVLACAGITHGTFIGHSCGSMIAQKYAAHHPNEVDALVLISSSYDFRKSFSRNRLKKFMYDHAHSLRQPLAAMNKAYGFINARSQAKLFDFGDKEFMTMGDLAFVLKMYAQSSPEQLIAYEAKSRAMDEWNTEQELALITSPTLLITGKNDAAVPPQTAFELHEAIASSLPPVVIPNARHGVVFQQPYSVNQAIEQFLLGEIYAERMRNRPTP